MNSMCSSRSISRSTGSGQSWLRFTSSMSKGLYKWRHRDLEEIESLLLAINYRGVHRTWVNTIYLHADQLMTNSGKATSDI
jgi:hypothetical protein